MKWRHHWASLFFVLSGFVLAWSACEDDTPDRFYRRRFARIYPAYAVVTAIAVWQIHTIMGASWKDFFAFTLLQS